MYRWISYTAQNIPGGQSFEVARHASIGDAQRAFDLFCREVNSDNCHASLFAYSDEAWATALEFAEIGCPFDYPDRVINRGPRGGAVVERV